jgi:polyhydroxybutyrate depolymerase
MRQFTRFLLLCCALLPLLVPAQTTVHTFMHGGILRSYRLYVPASYVPGTAAPLVFNLHGYGSNAGQQELYAGMAPVADTAGFLLCYPDGIAAEWNSGFTIPYNGGIDDVGFISTIIDRIAQDYSIDPARVFSCGMSNGGYMSYRLACDLESRIAAIASVTGAMTTIQTTNCNASRPVPVLEIHGDADATVPYYGASYSLSVDSVLGFWRNVNGCTAPVVLDTLPDLVAEGSYISTQYYGGCQAGTEVYHMKVNGGGHSWPGAFPVPSLGNTNQDVNASVEIWRFFYGYSHPAAQPLAAGEGLRPQVQLLPNPSTGRLRLEGPPATGPMVLLDLQGKEIARFAAASTLDLRAQAPGIYLLRFPTDAGWATEKVLLQR